MNDSGMPPAGWYPDPTGAVAGQKRWWNGVQWTADVQTSPPLQPEVPAQYAPPAYRPMRSFDSGSFAPEPARVPTSAATLPGLLLSVSPFPEIAIIIVFVTVGATIGLSQFALVSIPLIVILYFAWALLDRGGLLQLGFARPASWLWMLLGPFWYLLLRALRTHSEARIGFTYFVRYLVCGGIAVILSYLLMLFLPQT